MASYIPSDVANIIQSFLYEKDFVLSLGVSKDWYKNRFEFGCEVTYKPNMKTPDYVTFVTMDSLVTDDTLDAESASHLVDVDLSFSQITSLSKFVNVKKLGLNACVESLGKIQLDKLMIGRNHHITDKDLLSQTFMTILSVSERITDQGIKNLVNLKELEIRGDQITENGLKNLVNLEILVIWQSHHIRDLSFLPKLRILYCGDSQMTDQDLIKLKSLKELYLDSAMNITEEAIKCMNLDELHVDFNKNITEAVRPFVKRLYLY